MSKKRINHLEWIMLADKAFAFLAADRQHGLFRDIAPEIERRIGEADPYRELRNRHKEEKNMMIEVRSGKPIEAGTLAKIKAIFKESCCPNESMLHSIPEFAGYDGAGIVQLAAGDEYKEHIEVK